MITINLPLLREDLDHDSEDMKAYLQYFERSCQQFELTFLLQDAPGAKDLFHPENEFEKGFLLDNVAYPMVWWSIKNWSFN